jgi:heterotetrameric sarcosine oxidase gamma subunit
MEAQRQSPLHQCHIEAHGRLQSFFGWQLPAWYTQPTSEIEEVRASVGISDASYLSKLDLRGSTGDLSLSVPDQLWKLTSAHSLITSLQPIGFAASSSVTDVSSVYSAILLAGPKSREVLQRLTTLNVRAGAMPEGAARQTRLAHVNATILRSDCASIPGFLILNTRDVAEYVWHALLHAGVQFGIRPFGMVAQLQWMGFGHDAA